MAVSKASTQAYDENLAVKMVNIVKRFPGVLANDNINLEIRKREIHALLGENGAGKTTLMNILYGLYHQTSGEIFIHGKKVNISNPNVAIANGIGMVHQHFMLVEPFTVTENIILGMETTKGFDVAFGQLEGVLSQKVSVLRDELISTMAQLEVCIDYPEEDIEEITYSEVVKKLSTVEKGIDDLLSSSETGRIIRDGLSTVIVGKPNVGKSSLLNALLKEARAIVTDIPGTTRDVIEEFINIKGVPLKLIDTAGIRETEDVVEKIGVEKSKSFFNQADLVIFVVNASEALTQEDEEIIERIGEKRAIVVVNKVDLPAAFDVNELEARLPGKMFIRTSMMNEQGIEDVENQIAEMVFGGEVIRKENAYVSNIRHIRALEKAKGSIRSAIDATEGGMPYDFIEVDTKDTYEALGEITGETVEDDMMTKIFSNFCLGK